MSKLIHIEEFAQTVEIKKHNKEKWKTYNGKTLARYLYMYKKNGDIAEQNTKYIQMEKTLMSVEARKVLDIRDKELLYLIIEHKGKKVAINVGNKTYQSVVDMVEEPQPKLFTDEAANTKADAKTFTSK